MDKLLTRDDFREGVFARDKHKCVLCGAPAQDAHHILERRLWPDQGYYLNNGASVCGPCHIDCEATIVSVERVREAAGITKPIIPPHLYSDVSYDKWGNPILPNGQRLKGELYDDESVQKILHGTRNNFTHYVKYPRTYHLPWSNMGKDDRMGDPSQLDYVVVTEKMDGENTSMYRDYIHARSIDGRSHPSRDYVKQFHARICHEIPEGWRVCGENLFAKHSIGYDKLPDFFMGFSVWNERNICLSWTETLEWFELLGITPVPTLYVGPFRMFKHETVGLNYTESEGYVVRDFGAIRYGEFRQKVFKYVRPGHVQTTKHWMYGQAVQRNQLEQD